MSAWSVPDDLADETVALRAWHGTDAEWLCEGFNAPEVVAQSEQAEDLKVDSPQTAYEMVFEAARRARAGAGIGLAICRSADREPVGSLELDALEGSHDEAEIGFWVLGGCRRQGYARAAVELALEWAFGPLGLTRVWAEIDGGNAGSVALLRAVGFHESNGVTLPPSMPTRRTSVVLCTEPRGFSTTSR